MKFIYIRKQWIFVVAFALFLVLAGWYMVQPVTIFTSGQAEGFRESIYHSYGNR